VNDHRGGSRRAQPGSAAPLRVRALTPADWSRVADIYREGILARNATFETEVPTRDHWDGRHLARPRIVAELHEKVVGWAALVPYSTRPCYAGVVEDSVYVAEAVRGRRVGLGLLTELVALADALGIWTIQAGIFPENEASLALHERCGFRRVGVRERIGQLDGVWRDVVLLERRVP
jgi:L-amino acid N-acyltransferase YncA